MCYKMVNAMDHKVIVSLYDTMVTRRQNGKFKGQKGAMVSFTLK